MKLSEDGGLLARQVELWAAGEIWVIKATVSLYLMADRGKLQVSSGQQNTELSVLMFLKTKWEGLKG